MAEVANSCGRLIDEHDQVTVDSSLPQSIELLETDR